MAIIEASSVGRPSSLAKINIFESAQEAAKAAAEHMLAFVLYKPSAVLGLATGETQKPVYGHLVSAYRSGSVSFKDVSTFNLDEYLGLKPENQDSFANYMQTQFFQHVDIPGERINLLKGDAQDPILEAVRYGQRLLDSGGTDLQLLGIGGNGHIGFNEPGSLPQTRTGIVDLSRATIDDNRQLFHDNDKMPTKAISMGIADILDAREIMVVATGARKCEAVKRSLAAPVSSDCPASFLQTHPNVHWYLDKAAAAGVR